MGFDDLLGDRQAETGILPEALVRAVGVEALEDLIQGFGRMPGPSSSTTISTSFFSRRQVMRTVPPGGENERALSTRLLTTWPSRKSWPGTWKFAGPPPSKASVTVTSSVRTSLAAFTSAVEQLGEIDGGDFLALQLGIEPAGVGNIRDQPVEPLHVMLDHVEQPLAVCSVLAIGSVSTAERSEVSGLRNSCATSAAKLSIASMRE